MIVRFAMHPILNILNCIERLKRSNSSHITYLPRDKFLKGKWGLLNEISATSIW